MFINRYPRLGLGRLLNLSGGEIYSGEELTSWTFQWDLTL